MNAPSPAERLLELVGPLRLRNCPLTPTPRQEAFLRLPAPEALFGGAAGGGKSIALLMAAAQYSDVPGYEALLVRSTLPELERPGGLIDLSHDWFADRKAVWHGERRVWRFPGPGRAGAGGARIWFGYLDGQRDISRYAGSAFSFLGFDELSTIDETSYRRMHRILRQPAPHIQLGHAPDGTTLADVPVRVRATSNPGGPNHHWIKHYFVDPDSRPAGVAYLAARWHDNPHLDTENYLQQLAHLPRVERERLINGDWQIADEGEMFRREWFELIDRTAVPQQTRKVRYWDFAATVPTLANPDPDWTVGLRLELHDPTGTYYITGITRQRLHAGKVEQLVQATAHEDGPQVEIHLEQEPASNSPMLIEHYKRHVLRGYPVHAHKPSGSKEARAAAIAAAAENGLLKLVNGPYIHAFLDEIAGFPNPAGHDDQVDALAGAHHALGHRRTARRGAFVARGSIFDYPVRRGTIWSWD